jgi:hypothetical protein
VPFLGAAANITSKKPAYMGLPLGQQVAEHLAAKLHQKVADKRNLPRVSLLFERMLKRHALLEALKQLLPEKERQPSPLLALLAQLPVDLFVTTNYDRLLERALEPRQPYVVVQTDQELLGSEYVGQWSDQPDGQPRRPLVYKIHGTFQEPDDKHIDRSPVIITEDDYINFLTLLGSKANGVPTLIGSRLKTSMLLFLGYSLEDWDFRAIYKVLIESQEDTRFLPLSYSVQKAPPKFWEEFWRDKSVQIIDADIYAFADELKRILDEDEGAARQGAPDGRG